MFAKVFFIACVTLALSASNFDELLKGSTSGESTTILRPNLTSVIYSTVVHPNLTSIIHTTTEHTSLTSVIHTTAEHPNLTSIIHTTAEHTSLTSIIHTTAVHPNITSIIHTTAEHQTLTSIIHTTAVYPNLTSVIHTTAVHPTLTSIVPKTVSNQSITSIIFSTASHPNRTSIIPTSSIEPFYVTSSKVTNVVSSSVTPSITPTTAPPMVHYQFPENNSCIEFESEIGIKFPNIAQTVWLNQNASIKGSCGSSSFITLYYSSPLSIILTMNFYADAKEWSLTNITVNLVNAYSKLWSVQPGPIIKLWGVQPGPIIKLWSVQSGPIIKAPLNHSYHCEDETEYNLVSDKNSVTVILKSITIQSNIINGSYNKNQTVCSKSVSPKQSSSTVPIAVGGALAGLIVIVLIAYLIGKKRKSAGYKKL
ncbi:lysosome-associated membrane glycoprotein 1 isoform X1 [Hydra vulgaris]|uniref:lysosome-associated membrane glycoprotein 1 isoform X1 n=1 Tax=Hydra vulgaris TaxID=6087 RepID=UPI001F5F04B0|nr:lysosome-associated membrane glycoprotein 1 isoform X2 [Hydra vulgaris]